tara:strand:+ start:447 stop:632 length:186 start_codon:yes stop_codon:yes gene_type:complete
LDVALSFRFGGAVMPALGMLNGVSNFLMLINQLLIMVLGHEKVKFMDETTLKTLALHYKIR